MSPAGWYSDPWQPTRWRYFDGTAWTGWVHPPPTPDPQTAFRGVPGPAAPAPIAPGPIAPGPIAPGPIAPGPAVPGPVAPAPAAPFDAASTGSTPGGRGAGINASPAAWWWAGGTLGTLFVGFCALAWLVNR